MLRTQHKKRKPKRVSSSQRVKQLASASAHSMKKRTPLASAGSMGGKDFKGKGKGGGGTPNKSASGHGGGLGDKDRSGIASAGLASRGNLLGPMGGMGSANYSVNESLAEKKAQQAVEEKLQLRQEIKEISSRVERMVSKWEEEESKASTEFPAQFAEAQGNVRVLILNFEKLGMSRHQALDNLKVWFERLQVEGQQVETEVEEEVGDKVLESRRTLTRHDTAMDILDEKENGVMSVKYRVKQSILRCRQQLRDMSDGKTADMRAQLAQLEITLEEVTRLEEALEARVAIENEQRGEIQVLKLRCEGLESQLVSAKDNWSQRADEYEVLINQLEREVVQAEIKLRKQEQNLRATEMELATKDSQHKGANKAASTIRSFTSGEDTKDKLEKAQARVKALAQELRDARELLESRDAEHTAELEHAKSEYETLRKQGAWDVAREVKRARTEMEEKLAAVLTSSNEYQSQVAELAAELDARNSDLHRLRVQHEEAEEQLAEMEGIKTELVSLQKKQKDYKPPPPDTGAADSVRELYRKRMRMQERRHKDEMRSCIADMEAEADARVAALLEAHRQDVMSTAAELQQFVTEANQQAGGDDGAGDGGDDGGVGAFEMPDLPTEERPKRRSSTVFRAARIRKRKSVVGGGGALAPEHMPSAGAGSRRGSRSSVNSAASGGSSISGASSVASRSTVGSRAGASGVGGGTSAARRPRRRRARSRGNRRGSTGSVEFVVGSRGAVAYIASDDADVRRLRSIARRYSQDSAIDHAYLDASARAADAMLRSAELRKGGTIDGHLDITEKHHAEWEAKRVQDRKAAAAAAAARAAQGQAEVAQADAEDARAALLRAQADAMRATAAAEEAAAGSEADRAAAVQRADAADAAKAEAAQAVARAQAQADAASAAAAAAKTEAARATQGQAEASQAMAAAVLGEAEAATETVAAEARAAAAEAAAARAEAERERAAQEHAAKAEADAEEVAKARARADAAEARAAAAQVAEAEAEGRAAHAQAVAAQARADVAKARASHAKADANVATALAAAASIARGTDPAAVAGVISKLEAAPKLGDDAPAPATTPGVAGDGGGDGGKSGGEADADDDDDAGGAATDTKAGDGDDDDEGEGKAAAVRVGDEASTMAPPPGSGSDGDGAGDGSGTTTATTAAAAAAAVATMRGRGNLSAWVKKVVAERLQPLIFGTVFLRMKARRAESKNQALRTEVEQLTRKLESVVAQLDGRGGDGDGKAAGGGAGGEAWPEDVKVAVDENESLREVIRRQAAVLADVRSFLGAIDSDEARALMARIDQVAGMVEGIKQRPVPRLDPDEAELPLDADLSMLPLGKQVAHLNNIRKRLLGQLRDMQDAADKAAAEHDKWRAQQSADTEAAVEAARAAGVAAGAAASGKPVPPAGLSGEVVQRIHQATVGLVEQVGHVVTWVGDSAPAGDVARGNMDELEALVRTHVALGRGVPASAQAKADVIGVDSDIVSKLVATLAALGLGTPGMLAQRQRQQAELARLQGEVAASRSRGTPTPTQGEVVAPPPPEPDAVPPPTMGQLEVAETLAKRTHDIERMNDDLSRRQASLGREVEELDAKLQDSALDAGARRVLHAKRERRVKLMDAASEHMLALQRERERNLLLVMNAFARVHKLAKTVFKGHIYRHLVSSMGGVQEHLHMRTVLQYDGELGIGPLPPLQGHGLLKPRGGDRGAATPTAAAASPIAYAAPEFESSVDVDSSWSYTVPVVSDTYAQLGMGGSMGGAHGNTSPVGAGGGGRGGGHRSPAGGGSGQRSPAGGGGGMMVGRGSGAASGTGGHGTTIHRGAVSSTQRGDRDGGDFTADVHGTGYSVMDAGGHGHSSSSPPPVLIKHDDNWGTHRDPPPFMAPSRSPVNEDTHAGGGWAPGRAAREQRRHDSERFLARVKGAGGGGGGGGGSGAAAAMGGVVLMGGSSGGLSPAGVAGVPLGSRDSAGSGGFAPSRRFRSPQKQRGAGNAPGSSRRRNAGRRSGSKSKGSKSSKGLKASASASSLPPLTSD